MAEIKIDQNPIKVSKSPKGNKIAKYIGKGLASIAVCAMGAYCMWLTDGKTGVGWAILGMLFIWG
jgi:hypothetical protein